MKPKYVNIFHLSVADIVTIEFKFAMNADSEQSEVAAIAMQMGLLEGLHQSIGQALQDHKAKTANPNTNKMLS